MRESDVPSGAASQTTSSACSRGLTRSAAARLTARVLARTSRRARLRWGLWVTLAALAGLAAATLAAVSGYLTGQELVQSGAYALIQLAFEDRDLVAADAPGLPAGARRDCSPGSASSPPPPACWQPMPWPVPWPAPHGSTQQQEQRLHEVAAPRALGRDAGNGDCRAGAWRRPRRHRRRRGRGGARRRRRPAG